MRESPALRQLQLLLEECGEEEAESIIPVFCICCGKYMKRDMTESLTEEGEGRIFQWSRIKSLWQSSKQLLGYQGSLIVAIPTVHSAYRYLKMSHRIHSYKGSCCTA